jgi:hypothetical protein
MGVQTGSKGIVTLAGAGAKLEGASLDVGGSAAAQGGSGVLTVGAGSTADFSKATIWKTAVVKDAGALTLGALSGNGSLDIERGGRLKIEGDDPGVSLDFTAGSAETLDLIAAHLPATPLSGFGMGDTVHIAALGVHDTISVKSLGASAVVDFVQAGRVVGALDFLGAASEQNSFRFDAATGALRLI